jgi:hypothetical protein
MKSNDTFYPIAGIIIALICFMLPAQTLSQEASAMVTAVDGSATYEAEGVSINLEIGSELPSGALVNIGSGTASLVFMSGELIELAAGDKLTLGADIESSTLMSSDATRGPKITDGITVAEEGLGKANSDKWQSQLANIYGVRGDASVVAVAPRLAISSTAPVFYWFDSDSLMRGVERTYTLILKNEEGKEIMRSNAKGKVYEMNAFVPQSLPGSFKVQPGNSYTWTVSEKGKGSASDPEATFIYIDDEGLKLAAAKREKMDGLRRDGKINEQAYHSILAMYYLDERERLFSDAILHLLALETQPSGMSYSHTQLALLLNRFGNEVSTAAAYYARKAK